MKVAVDASILEPPCPTGVERAAAALVAALPDAIGPGDEVLLLSRGAVPGGTPHHARFHAVSLGGPEAPLVWRETHLAPALADLGADVLWSPVTAVPLRTRVPRVATFHEAPWLVRPGLEGFLRERAHSLRLRIAAEVAARIVCPSEASAAQVRTLHPSSASLVRVVPHGVSRDFFSPPVADGASRRAVLGVSGPYLLQVGGTRARKNVPLLLAAYARYRLRGGQSALVLAGPGPAPDRVPRGVVATGWVDDTTLLALYDGASAVVVSSVSEGFGLPVLEAMARGRPVVATDAGGLVEAAGGIRDGAALLVRSGDADAFATALLRIEHDPALRALLVARGRRRAESCGWPAAAARLVAVLREVVLEPERPEELPPPRA